MEAGPGGEGQLTGRIEIPDRRGKGYQERAGVYGVLGVPGKWYYFFDADRFDRHSRQRPIFESFHGSNCLRCRFFLHGAFLFFLLPVYQTGERTHQDFGTDEEFGL